MSSEVIHVPSEVSQTSETPTTNGNTKQLRPKPTEDINSGLQNLSIKLNPIHSKVVDTVVSVNVIPPPVLQISQPPDQEDGDVSTSEYESFPDTASEPDDDNVKLNKEITKGKSTKQRNTSPKVIRDEPDQVEVGHANERVLKLEVDGKGSEPEDTTSTTEIKQWTPPDEALQEKIVKQVEFYFSDANIVKDAFLLKHVRRNKHGFVSIKLISSFKKVRKLTKDWQSVSYSLIQLSEDLEVNSEQTKVMRKKPLPEFDLTTPGRTVVVVNLPDENPSVDALKDMFKLCGKVTLVRIIKPNKPFPRDVSKHIGNHPEIQDKVCALVEFEKSDAAQQAVKTMNNENDWRSGLRVTLLAKVELKKKKDKRTEKAGIKEQGSFSGGDGDIEKGKQKKRKKNKNKNRVDVLSHDGCLSVTPSSSDCENSPSPHRRYINKPIPIPQSHHLSPSSTPKSSPCPSPLGSPRGQRKYQGGRSSPHIGSPHSGSPHLKSGLRGSLSPHGSPELRRKVYDKSDKDGQSDSSNSPSPWVQRRRLLAAQNQNASPGSSPMLTRRMIDPGAGIKPHMSGVDGIIRQPKGPETDKGFYCGKGRGQSL